MQPRSLFDEVTRGDLANIDLGGPFARLEVPG